LVLPDEEPDPDVSDTEDKKPKTSSKIGGRISQQRYTGLTNIYLTSVYTLGQRCLQSELGNLNRYNEMVLIRLDGNIGNKVHVVKQIDLFDRNTWFNYVLAIPLD
jgi:hypothetical protein